MSSRDNELYQKLTTHYSTTGELYFLRREQPIDVMRYLPKFLREEPEFLKVQDTLSWEHEKLKAKSIDIARQFYIETATWGLNSWERIFEVVPPVGASYELRRALVKAKMAGWGVMTKSQSEGLVNQFVTEKDAYIIELPEPGTLSIVIPSGTNYPKELRQALDEMIPAHLVFGFRYVVNYGGASDLEDHLDITEDRWWIVQIAQCAKDIYPWRGRTFDTSWTFIPAVSFDGTWSLDGEYHFDGIPVGAEDDAGVRFAFDGDWWFDGARRFGYPISRKVLWGTAEPDELTVIPRTAIQEQYTVQLPFNVLTPFDTGWAFGARDGPQDARFDVGVAPVLLERLNLQDEEVTVIRPILRDVYPLARIRSFDGSWYFREVIPYDGLWQWQGDPRYRFLDNRYEPWKHLPVSFFGEVNKTLETVYEEAQLSFDGSWSFTADIAARFGESLYFDGLWAFATDSAIHFGQTLQISHTVVVEDDSYSGKHYDGSWRFFGLHDADAFWDEDSQECFRILDDEPEAEALQVQEESLLQTGAEFAESILHCPAFDGSWQFEGLSILGTASECFEALPAFGEGKNFNNTWAFERCSHAFDGSWSLGEDPVHFDGVWHFGGERYFAANDIEEQAEAIINPCITERLEHYAYFGTEKTAFDGLWKFGGSDGLQEMETTLQIATGFADAEEPQEEATVSISVGFREELPSAPVTPFDGGWAFAGLRPFDGGWAFAEWQTFGAPEDGCPVFRQEMEAEYLQVDEIEEGSPAYSDTLRHIDTFDRALAFDGAWAFGKTDGMSEGLEVSITSVAHFDDTWAFDDEPRKIDGTWSLGDEDYAFGENINPRNTYDGSWNFDSMNTRIRFERRWRSFGSITFAA